MVCSLWAAAFTQPNFPRLSHVGVLGRTSFFVWMTHQTTQLEQDVELSLGGVLRSRGHILLPPPATPPLNPQPLPFVSKLQSYVCVPGHLAGAQGTEDKGPWFSEFSLCETEVSHSSILS